jgi:hypothetical protein
VAAQDLTTLAKARAYLQKETGDTGQDVVLGDEITRASDEIMDFCKREFAPATASATRRFRVYPHRKLDGHFYVDLDPYDLRSVTSVTLHPESASPVTLIATDEYILDPEGKPEGTYTAIRLSPVLSLSSEVQSRFGFAYLDIAGAWGFSAVPSNVEKWALVTIWTWMRGDVQSYSTTFSVSEDRIERPESLPSAVRRGLARWARKQRFPS